MAQTQIFCLSPYRASLGRKRILCVCYFDRKIYGGRSL